MALTSRERYITIAVLVAAGIFALDRLALSPYVARRAELTEQLAIKSQNVADAQALLGREQRLRSILTGMGPTLRSDASTIEGELLHLLQGWQQKAGLGNASFQRVQAMNERGFMHLRFHVAAVGSLPSVAMLLYEVERSPIPLRVDDVQVTPKRESGDELQVQITVSTLGRQTDGSAPPAVRGGTRGVAALDGPAGGRQ